MKKRAQEGPIVQEVQKSGGAMRARGIHTILLICLIMTLGLVTFIKQPGYAAAHKLLVFHAQWSDFKHNSMSKGIEMFKSMAIKQSFDLDVTEEPTVFTDANLEQYDAIAFLLTQGNFFNDKQKSAFQNFIRSGKGYVGLHCADNTLNDWDWYNDMLGSTFKGDMWTDALPLIILDENNPSTKDLPNPWIVSQQYRKNNWFFDEYTHEFDVLIKVDPAFYEGHIGTGSDDWSNQSFIPYVYTHEYEGGRVWYGAMGHSGETFENSNMINLISWGVDYAFGKFAAKD